MARTCSIARGALLFAAACLISAAPAPTARAQGFPSPADWRDESLYQLLTDRFDDGDPANNTLQTNYSPSAGAQSHGGDYAGIRRRLYYLRGLGITGLWISPHLLNGNGEYHGYAARDFYAHAPQFGSLAELQQLIADCHALGIRVVLDVVCNHGGDLFNNNGYLAPPGEYTLTYRNLARTHAAPFDSTQWWHKHGSIGNFTDPEQILGELFGLDDLRTEDPYVRGHLVDIWSYWITTLDADAFRIDTVKHTELDFWQVWAPAVRANAAAFGKTNFFMFGEVFDGSDFKNGIYTGTQAGGPFALDSVLHYPVHYATNSVFAHGSTGAQEIVNRYNALASNYDAAARERLVTFLDNHDNPRFLHSSLANNNTDRLHAALAFQYTARGIPCLYYGTEQYFNGGNDPFCREDMFDGQFEQGPSLGNNFDQTAAGYRYVRRLNQLRREHEALRRGTFTTRQVSSSPGLFAYSRLHAGKEVLVLINTGTSSSSTSGFTTSYANGTILRDQLNPASTITVSTGGLIPGSIPVSPLEARVYVPDADYLTLDPDVTDCSIPIGTTISPVANPLILTFSQAMNTAATEAAFQTTPTVTGSFSWTAGDTVLTFEPSGASWPGPGLIRAGIAESATDAGGRSLRGGFQTEFSTTPSYTDNIDGTIAGDPRWPAAIATQTMQTQFGNNSNSQPDGNSGGSEANELYFAESPGHLYFAVSGNLEPNGNSLILFLDTDGGAGGAATLNGSGATLPWLANSPSSAAGTVLPTGMRANIALQVQLTGPGQTLSLHAFTWDAAGDFQSDQTVGTIPHNPGYPTAGSITGNVNGQPYTLIAAYDNSHTGPVGAGTGLASPNGAGAQTGLEIRIPKSLTGIGPMRVLAGISGNTGFWSNQFLPPGTTTGGNLGFTPNLNTRNIPFYDLGLVPVALTNFSAE